jgi:hypothetical protein
MSTFHTITNQVKQSCQRNVEAITDLIQANARRGASHFLVSRNAGDPTGEFHPPPNFMFHKCALQIQLRVEEINPHL